MVKDNLVAMILSTIKSRITYHQMHVAAHQAV